MTDLSCFVWSVIIGSPSAIMGDAGLEHCSKNNHNGSKSAILKSGGAKSDAHDAPKVPKDPDLDRVVKVWPELPEHIKAAIMALIISKQEKK